PRWWYCPACRPSTEAPRRGESSRSKIDPGIALAIVAGWDRDGADLCAPPEVAGRQIDEREVVEGGVAAGRGVPALDEFEDGQAGVDLGLEAGAIEKLALERGEEALAERVVVRVANRAHGRPHAHLATALPEPGRRVLAALEALMCVKSRALDSQELEHFPGDVPLETADDLAF